MTDVPGLSDRLRLQRIAHRVMIEKGLVPDFPPRELDELSHISGPAPAEPSIRDLRELLWCSIDNDDSRDLDQLTVAEALPDGVVRAMVAIADVDALVKLGSAIDNHASQNTTSVYTMGAIFPMLPERLSTDLTSLGFGVDRLAMVVDMTFGRDGALQKSDIYRGLVRNRAKLAYNGVGAWLEGKGPIPPAITAVPGLEANLRLQDELTQKLQSRRHKLGALDLETIEPHPVFQDSRLLDFVVDTRNRARTIIEDFMIAANGVGARFLSSRRRTSFRRVVRKPKNWDRLIELARDRGFSLPLEPDAAALEEFLLTQKRADPARFPDLSLSVVKLLGPGEYVVERPGDAVVGHFGLAVQDYAHSTAPNRRFPDLITQRLVKAAVADVRPPYGDGMLIALAKHCTEAENAAKKVERQVAKSAAALLLQNQTGRQFDALVTGAGEKGTWVRVLHPPVEGKLVSGNAGAKVGDRLRVKLLHADVERGYIDFERVGG